MSLRGRLSSAGECCLETATMSLRPRNDSHAPCAPATRALRTFSLQFLILAVFGAAGVPVATAQDQHDHLSASLRQAEPAVFRAALQNVMPALVRIETIGGAMPVERVTTPDGETVAASGFRQADGPTTGLICNADGYILTSSFNFVRDPTVITVALADGRRFVARLVARDRAARLALLKIDAAGLPIPEWSPQAQWRVGQWALLAGYGHGGDAPALSAGIISALSRLDRRAVQTDVRASPANYGGPLFDLDGRVIGICVPKAGKGEDEVAGVEWYDSGIGFAIRSDYIEQVLPTLRAGRDFEPGYLGLRLDPADPVVGGNPEEAPQGGVRVMELVPGGPAAEAGLAAGDLITSIEQHPTTRSVEASRILARMPAGQRVSITYIRDGAEKTCSLVSAKHEELAHAAPASSPTGE
jgi:serine protease Do